MILNVLPTFTYRRSRQKWSYWRQLFYIKLLFFELEAVNIWVKYVTDHRTRTVIDEFHEHTCPLALFTRIVKLKVTVSWRPGWNRILQMIYNCTALSGYDCYKTGTQSPNLKRFIQKFQLVFFVKSRTFINLSCFSFHRLHCTQNFFVSKVSRQFKKSRIWQNVPQIISNNYLKRFVKTNFQWKFRTVCSNLKIYTTLGYIVSLILLNLGHVFRFRIISRMCLIRCESEILVPSSRGSVKQYNQELCISSKSGCFTKRLQSRPSNSLFQNETTSLIFGKLLLLWWIIQNTLQWNNSVYIWILLRYHLLYRASQNPCAKIFTYILIVVEGVEDVVRQTTE